MDISENALDILQKEYKHLWEYYQSAINEMFKLFDWYFRIVTIPSVLIGGFGYWLKPENSSNIHQFYFGIIFIVIFLCGLSLYITYAKQSATISKYDIAITLIREKYRKTFPAIENTIILDKLREDKGKPNLGSVKFWRGSTIAWFNSLIFCIGIFLIFDLGCHEIFLIFLLYISLIIIHFWIYNIFYKNYESKSNRLGLINTQQ